MNQPEALKNETPLQWSTGIGSEVWALFCACIDGDLEVVKSLLEHDSSLVRCHYRYRKPLYFAVRENQIEVAAFLLDRDPDPTGLAVNDTLIEISRDRGYGEMQQLPETTLAKKHGASPEGEPVAEAIRNRDFPTVRLLLDASPRLIHIGDGRACQPIHWAVMTRQIAKFGESAMVELFLERGAETNLPDDPAWATPLAWANRRGHAEIAGLLRRHGAR